MSSRLQAKQRSSALGEQVVDPSNTSRIRLLGGRIPEKEELVAKLQVCPWLWLAAAARADADCIWCRFVACQGRTLKGLHASAIAACFGACGAEQGKPMTAQPRSVFLPLPPPLSLPLPLQSLEERLGMQQDSLMEKGVVLEEVDALTSHLREEAAAARPVGASLAAAANAYQERLRKVTRGMMATISELSLYQVGGGGSKLEHLVPHERGSPPLLGRTGVVGGAAAELVLARTEGEGLETQEPDKEDVSVGTAQDGKFRCFAMPQSQLTAGGVSLPCLAHAGHNRRLP